MATKQFPSPVVPSPTVSSVGAALALDLPSQIQCGRVCGSWPSAVNDPTVTKQVNSGKSCLEEVSQSLIYQVALINQYLVHLHGDFRRNKESTKNLASSTKTKNSFVSIAGFVELLLLLFLSIAAR